MSSTRRSFLQASALPLTDFGRLGGGDHEITILYTNDFHSAFEPFPAYWLKGAPLLGGAAHLATLIARERAAAPGAFLFDSGDMFTGTISAMTNGEALMEMMTLMRYDAMGVGNHEFDYGWQLFDLAMARVPFPVLCCNVRHRGNGIRFARPYTIVERQGARLGVIGVMGANAARYTIMPSKVAELEFTDPAEETRRCIEVLRPAVDLIVVLAHQGLPGPMQTDAENDPEVQRSMDEDVRFCGEVRGIDVYIAAHSHRGLEQPIVHPDTGTILTQTYGYGTRLGRLRLSVRERRVVRHDVRLLPVWSEQLPPGRAVARRIARYREVLSPRIGPPFATAKARIVRKYNRESPLGSLVGDAMRTLAGSEAALINSGGLRADLPEGPLDRAAVLDCLPFLNTSVTLALSGRDLREAIEQGLSLQAGMVQVSGLAIEYDRKRPAGSRLVRCRVGAEPLQDDRIYRVSTSSFMSEGGDGYRALQRGRRMREDPLLSDVLAGYIRARQTVSPPPSGRLVMLQP
jgi:2',3'-cyclic-nucleotide 2'-phosphodiesterase (5'-nucleotidase family)